MTPNTFKNNCLLIIARGLICTFVICWISWYKPNLQDGDERSFAATGLTVGHATRKH
ncbi:MAG: hypothetical protein F6K55_00600 [Moorea sp. SIO4A3]|nr:hypothetical protein [Moorena sp. SIO4A3]